MSSDGSSLAVHGGPPPPPFPLLGMAPPPNHTLCSSPSGSATPSPPHIISQSLPASMYHPNHMANRLIQCPLHPHQAPPPRPPRISHQQQPPEHTYHSLHNNQQQRQQQQQPSHNAIPIPYPRSRRYLNPPSMTDISQSHYSPPAGYLRSQAPPAFSVSESGEFIRVDPFDLEYRVGPVLGKGGFGTVYGGVRSRNREKVAIKEIAKSKITEWGHVRIQNCAFMIL